MDKTDRLRDYGLAFLLYEQGLGVCGYELIRELFIFVKLILNSYLCVFIDPQSDGATETVCKLKSCQYYSYSTGDKEELKRSRDWVEKWNKYQSKYPYISIYARVMKIEINGKGIPK